MVSNMKCKIGELDSGAVHGEIYYRNVEAICDSDKMLIYIYDDYNELKEIVNMRSLCFHNIVFQDV